MCFYLLVSCLSGLINSHPSRAQYGPDTGNPAATFHEVRVWREQYEPEGNPLIPLRMVSSMTHVRAMLCFNAHNYARADLAR